MEMKKWILAVMAMSSIAFAHDGGHGPKAVETATQGGVRASVVNKSDANLGTKAEKRFSGELVRSEDGSVSVFVTDASEKSVTGLNAKASAVLLFKKNKKLVSVPFELAYSVDSFKGKLPKPGNKPFSIEVTFNDGKQELLVAFEYLD